MEYIDFVKTKKQYNLRVIQLQEKKIQVEKLEEIFSNTEKYLSKFKGIENQFKQLLTDASFSGVNDSLKLAEKFSRKAPLVDDKLVELESFTSFPTDEVQANFQNQIQLIRSNLDVQNMDFAIKKSAKLIETLHSERRRLEKELELKRLEELRLEGERKERLEKERLSKIEKERKEKERLERERLAKAERERLEKERLEANRLARLEVERQARLKRNKKIAKYIGIALAIGLGIWIIIAFIIPFVVEWWPALLLLAIAIGYFALKD